MEDAIRTPEALAEEIDLFELTVSDESDQGASAYANHEESGGSMGACYGPVCTGTICV